MVKLGTTRVYLGPLSWLFVASGVCLPHEVLWCLLGWTDADNEAVVATGVGLGHKECCNCYRGRLRPPDML